MDLEDDCSLSDPTEVSVEFQDGMLTCMGRIHRLNGDVLSMDEGAMYERARALHLEIMDDGELETPAGTIDLDEGDYIVNQSGLWMKICGP